MIKLLDFVMSKRTVEIVALTAGTLNMRVCYFFRVASSITVVVVEATAREFMIGGGDGTIRTSLCLEGVKIEAEELILVD